MTTPEVRRAGNGGGKITRDVVLAAALEIIDRDGADALSMRRLARALDRDPMIVYRHAPGKAALLNGVAETVLAQLDVESADPDWAGQLREVARRFRALALAHPHVVRLIVTRPLATPLGLRPLGTLRPLEDILALLTRAGFSGPDALHIYRALFGFLHGHVLDELQELTVSPDETDDLLRLGLHRLPIGDFPLLRSRRQSWPPTTAPPNSNAAWTSCSPGSPAPCLPQAKPARPCQHSTRPADPPLRRPGGHARDARGVAGGERRWAALAPPHIGSLFRQDPLGVLVRRSPVRRAGGRAGRDLAEEPLLLAEEVRVPEFNQFTVDMCRSARFTPAVHAGTVESTGRPLIWSPRDAACTACAPPAYPHCPGPSGGP